MPTWPNSLWWIPSFYFIFHIFFFVFFFLFILLDRKLNPENRFLSNDCGSRRSESKLLRLNDDPLTLLPRHRRLNRIARMRSELSFLDNCWRNIVFFRIVTDYYRNRELSVVAERLTSSDLQENNLIFCLFVLLCRK